MAAIANSSAQLIRSFTQYEYLWKGFLTLVRYRRAIPTKVYRQWWTADTAATNIGAPGGSYAIYRTEYVRGPNDVNAVVESEWRDETGA